MADLFVWRMSTKKTGRCPKCKCLIRGEDNYPTDNVGVDTDGIYRGEQLLYCLGCRAKGKATVLGAVKTINQTMYDELAKDIYKDMDWDSLQKMANRNAKESNKKADTIDSLKGQIRKLQFENSSLKGQVDNLKYQKTKAIEARDAQIQALTKEIETLEHRMEEMARENTFGGLSDE